MCVCECVCVWECITENTHKHHSTSFSMYTAHAWQEGGWQGGRERREGRKKEERVKKGKSLPDSGLQSFRMVSGAPFI